jgi:hypothetical protein
MPDYDATLKQRLQDVVDGSGVARKAMEQASKYWREVYRIEVPNAEKQLVPSSLMQALDEYASRLDFLATAISARL